MTRIEHVPFRRDAIDAHALSDPRLRTKPSGRTSHPRIWAAGNITNLAANVPMSMGAGSAVGGAVNAALMHEDTQNAIADQR